MQYYVNAIKNYATFTGRTRRRDFWMFVLFHLIFFIAAGVLDSLLGTNSPEMGGGLVSGLYALFALVPSIAIAARRLHDSGKSGWWLLIGLTGIGGIVLLVFYVLDSQPGANKYGPNPKGMEVAHG